MIRLLLGSRRLFQTVAEALALFGFASLVLICMITLYDGLARYLWLPRIPGFRDFGEVIFAVLIASCFPIGLLRNQNIAVTFLGTALGPRVTALLNLFAALAVLVGFCIIVYGLWLRTGNLGVRMSRTGFFRLEPWAWVATGVMVVALVVQVWVVLARLAEAVSGVRLVDDHGGLTESGMEEGLTAGADAYAAHDVPSDPSDPARSDRTRHDRDERP
jgi:TRAP-type C4-dicarboxylate transport system permease small subunit